MKKFGTLLTGLMLFLALGAFAQVSAATPKVVNANAAVTRQSEGIITSVAADRLVLSHKVRGKEEATTLMITNQTKKEGELKNGEKSTVHYRVEKGKDIATLVRVLKPMAKTPADK